MLFRN
jgi:hypothetical protein